MVTFRFQVGETFRAEGLGGFIWAAKDDSTVSVSKSHRAQSLPQIWMSVNSAVLPRLVRSLQKDQEMRPPLVPSWTTAVERILLLCSDKKP